jgi:hypothetical protein
MGFDTHMILETVPVLPSTRQNAHQVINRTSRHYAEAMHRQRPDLPRVARQTGARIRPSCRTESASGTSIDGMTMRDGEDQGEHSPSRRSSRIIESQSCWLTAADVGDLYGAQAPPQCW